MNLRCSVFVATSLLTLAGCASEPPIAATPKEEGSAPVATASAAPPATTESAGAGTASAAPSASPAIARKPFAPDQAFVHVAKGRVKLIQLWQRNEGVKDKQTNLSAEDACASSKQRMGWVVDSGMLTIETDVPAAAGPLAAKDVSFRYDTEDGKVPNVEEGRAEIVSIDTKPAGAGSLRGLGKLKLFARDASGKLVDGTFDATVCIDPPSFQ